MRRVFRHTLDLFVIDAKTIEVPDMVRLRVRVMMTDGHEWDPVLIDLQGIALTEAMPELAVIYRNLPFAASYQKHAVTLTKDEDVFRLPNAELSNFLYTCNDAGLSFIIEAPRVPLTHVLKKSRVQAQIEPMEG